MPVTKKTSSARSLAPPFPTGPATFAAGLRRGPRVCRGMPSVGSIHRRRAESSRPTHEMRCLRPESPPPRGAFSSGAGGPSPAHGRQQAGLSRVGLRSAEFRGSQSTGFDGKGILKDHGSLSASLVSFCARRKKLALRRNRSRGFRDRPPDAGRYRGPPGVIGGKAPYTKTGWWAGSEKSRPQAKPPQGAPRPSA